MKKAVLLVFVVFCGAVLFAQNTDDYGSFQFTKAPNTAHVETRAGNMSAIEFDYLNMTASTEDIDVTVQMFAVNPVFNFWNGKAGLVLSFPVSYVWAETDAMDDLETAGVAFMPSVGGAAKLAGELDGTNLMGFGGLTVTPVNRIWLWNDFITLELSMPSVSFHAGLKGNIVLAETVTFIPFAMFNATQAWVEIDMYNSNFSSSDSVNVPLTFAPVIGFDINIMKISMGAMVDFKEDSTSFNLHIRIPITKTYNDEK